MNCAVHTDTTATAYCRTCGKALCENCKRDVQGAIYCEPCIAARLQGQPAVRPPASAPSPGIALMLGFIPGVGAMYNGQFVKGFVHAIIFVMLVIAANSISEYFGWLVAFFIFYMVFDAYKTAQARVLGQPAPDPLGIDKLFGLQENQPTTPVSSATAPAGTTSAPAAYSAVTPFSETTTTPPGPPAAPANNQPVGAIVLIALVVVFLLGSIGHFHVGKLWPLFLIGIGLWIGYKRLVMKA